MKQKKRLKGYTKLIFAIGLIFVSVSLIIHMKYDVSLNQYLAFSEPLTQGEKEYLKGKETLVVSTDFNKAPYFFVNDETGEYKGLLKDYLDYMAADMRIKIEYRDKSECHLEDSICKNEIDISDIFYSRDLNTKYAMTQSVYNTRGVLVTEYNSEIKKLRDLSGRKLAVERDIYTENAIKEVLPEGSNVNMVYVKNTEEGLKELKAGKVDAFAGNRLVVDQCSRNLGIKNDLRIVADELYKGDVAFATNIYNAKLNNILNKELIKLKKQRVYGELQEEWLGSASLMGAGSTSVRWAERIISICVALVILLMIWESVLNKKIDDKTYQIEIERRNLKTVVDNISAMVAVINKNGDIQTCNEYGLNMLGMSEHALMGCNINSVPMLKELGELYIKNPEKPFHYYEDRYYQIRLSHIGKSEENKLVVITDCTEQTIAEQKMRQESKMIAVGQLSAGLTHEIRNPLGLIKSYAYLLGEYATDDMSSHALKVINESVKRIDGLIDNLLNFSRLSNDKPVNFSVTQMTENIIELGRKTFQKEKVTIVFNPGKDIIITTFDEPVKIVIYNLVNNAVEAFREAVQTDGEIEISEVCENGMLKIVIKDNGPGMNEETVENIFNPFFTTKDTGTGLGLYIVITELKKINGQISVKSQLGKGTVFTVEIPVKN